MGSNNDPVSHYPVDCCCRQCEKMLTLDSVCLCTFKWAVCVDAEFVNRSVKVVVKASAVCDEHLCGRPDE